MRIIVSISSHVCIMAQRVFNAHLLIYINLVKYLLLALVWRVISSI